MSVIPFPRWRVFCHVDAEGRNTIRLWLDRNGVSSALRNTLQVWIDLVESGGPEAIPGGIVTVSRDLEAFKSVRKGEPPVYLIFRRGVFANSEITILAGSRNRKCDLTEARKNLAAIERDKRRRKHERITR